MLDPEFENFLGEDEKPVARRGRKVSWAVMALLSAYLLGCSIESPRRFTCSACRLERLDHRWLGLRSSSYEETDCSRWYAQNVEPTHKHIWANCAHCRRFGIPGLYGGFSCSTGEQISGLSRMTQIRIYQKFRDSKEAKPLFVQLGRSAKDNGRLMQSLCEWVDTNPPETWDEWWAKHR